MKKILYLLAIAAITSCNKSTNTIREDASYSVITEGLYTNFPGDLLYNGEQIIWTDPMSETFVHIIDSQTGAETKSMIKIGQGPNDFASPSISLYGTDSLYIRDLFDDKETYINFDSDYIDYSVGEMTDKRFAKADTYIPIAKDTWLSFGAFEENELPFAYANRTSYKRFGNFPITGDFEDKSDFQGYVAFNRERNILIYSVSDFPYMASYSIGKEISKKWEIAPEIDYSIADNELKIDSKTQKGGYYLSLTKNHIATMEYDYEVDEVVYPVGRDFSNVPHKIFIRNYDGKLERIIDVKKPVVRLTGSETDDNLYAIIVDEEFKIIKITL